jgi:hypothetical protein
MRHHDRYGRKKVNDVALTDRVPYLTQSFSSAILFPMSWTAFFQTMWCFGKMRERVIIFSCPAEVRMDKLFYCKDLRGTFFSSSFFCPDTGPAAVCIPDSSPGKSFVALRGFTVAAPAETNHTPRFARGMLSKIKKECTV